MWGENERQSENFRGGGGSGDSHSQVIIGTAGKPKTTLCLLVLLLHKCGAIPRPKNIGSPKKLSPCNVCIVMTFSLSWLNFPCFSKIQGWLGLAFPI